MTLIHEIAEAMMEPLAVVASAGLKVVLLLDDGETLVHISLGADAEEEVSMMAAVAGRLASCSGNCQECPGGPKEEKPPTPCKVH